MAKQKNANIGMVPCAMCGDHAAVRRNRSGKLYYDCIKHGRITPNTAGGQDWVLERATIWGEQSPPASAPRWIAEQWPWGRAVSDAAGAAPYNGGNPPAAAAQPPAQEPIAPRSTGDNLPPPPPAPVEREKPRKVVGFDFLPFGD